MAWRETETETETERDTQMGVQLASETPKAHLTCGPLAHWRQPNRTPFGPFPLSPLLKRNSLFRLAGCMQSSQARAEQSREEVGQLGERQWAKG